MRVLVRVNDGLGAFQRGESTCEYNSLRRKASEFPSILLRQHNPPGNGGSGDEPGREYGRFSRKHGEFSPEGVEEQRWHYHQKRAQYSLQQETGALHEDRGLGARDAYQQMHAEADECAAQSADGDADRSDPLHQPDTQRYIDACLDDGADRGEMLFSRSHHHQDVGKGDLTNYVAENQHLQIKSTLEGVSLSNLP